MVTFSTTTVVVGSDTVKQRLNLGSNLDTVILSSSLYATLVRLLHCIDFDLSPPLSLKALSTSSLILKSLVHVRSNKGRLLLLPAFETPLLSSLLRTLNHSPSALRSKAHHYIFTTFPDLAIEASLSRTKKPPSFTSSHAFHILPNSKPTLFPSPTPSIPSPPSQVPLPPSPPSYSKPPFPSS